MTEGHCKPSMIVQDRNIVTTPGASEPQGSALVGGTGVKAGSNVVGPLRSSPNDHEGTGVASLAPATPNTTSAEGGISKLHKKLIAANSGKQPGTQTAFTNLQHTIKLQFKIISGILAATDNLQRCKEKSKSPVVLEAIERVTGATENLKTSTNSLHSAFYEAEKALLRETSEQKSGTDAVTPALAETRAAITEIRGAMEKQGALLEELSKQVKLQHQQKANEATTLRTSTPTRNEWKSLKNPQNPQDQPQCSNQATNEFPTVNEWRTVKKSRKEKRDRKEHKTEGSKRKRQKPPPPDAIAVRPGVGETAAEILKTIKHDVEVDKIGAKVSTIIESKSGEIIIRLNKKDTKRTELEDELRSKLGARAGVRGLVKLEDVEIQDLDSVTTATDVETSIRHALGALSDDQTIQVKSLRPSYMGTQRATVRMKSTDAYKLEKAGRVKIGWVYARTRIKIRAIKCFRCLGYGHRKQFCTGIDRSDKCCLCTSKGHTATTCKSPPKCAACEDIKEKTDHYPGSGKCIAYQRAMVANKTNPRANEQRGPNTDSVAQTPASHD